MHTIIYIIIKYNLCPVTYLSPPPPPPIMSVLLTSSVTFDVCWCFYQYMPTCNRILGGGGDIFDPV